jgi:Type VI secretion system/phage-baseplate injector OB domain
VKTYFGKYRGVVVNNVDPDRMGRLLITCPHVLGLGQAWAMPCVPFAGPLEGFFMMPLPASNVWVEFEEGDADRPIWSGCFWTQQTIPVDLTVPLPTVPLVHTIRTVMAQLTLDSTPGTGGITMQMNSPPLPFPCKVSCSATGIEIQVGAAIIKLDPAKVDVNNGALQVI